MNKNSPKGLNSDTPKDTYIIGSKKSKDGNKKEPYLNGPKDPFIKGPKKPQICGSMEHYSGNNKEPEESQKTCNMGSNEDCVNGPKALYILGTIDQRHKEQHINLCEESYVPHEPLVVGPKDTYITGALTSKVHSRPGGYGPDGASDSPRPSPSNRPQGYHELNNGVSSKTSNTNETITLWPEKDQNTEHVALTKPPSVQRMFAGSPALSVTSLESEQYSEFPSRSVKSYTVSTPPATTATMTSLSTSSKSKLDDIKARASARNERPISISAGQRIGNSRKTTNEKTGYKPRDKYKNNNSPLPSRPSVAITTRTSKGFS